ncbi:hypothetical protein [Neorickettsia sp. 179522]|uniref:hypothetical protein n=1 Tax=Neorickettsia sp. 179522 TaxID=1714371 RepID=UPI000604807B|nr:hypothetical protein [Neorickettsia sp. 179522]KYH12954.1 hypothetical protein AS219_03665 [Neorickettsia sp. 179522]
MMSLEFPLHDDDALVHVEGSIEDFSLICDDKDLSRELPNLQRKDEISYVIDHDPRYNPTLIETIKVLEHDKKDGKLPEDDARTENKAIMNVLKHLDEEAKNAKKSQSKKK